MENNGYVDKKVEHLEMNEKNNTNQCIHNLQAYQVE
jgi:hypothetical protein